MAGPHCNLEPALRGHKHPHLQSSPPTSSCWSLEDLALMHVRRVLYPVVADTRPSRSGKAAGFCAFPRQGHRSRGACVGVCRSSPGARTFLSPLAEDIHRRLSNCYRRRFWRPFGPLLGEISRTGGRGHSRYCQQQRRGPPGEPHFLRRFLGRWRHSPSLRRSSKPFPSGTLAAQTPAGASRWPQPEPRPEPSSAASPAL